jgi:hypothetical protein
MVALLAVLSGAMALPVCGSIRHKSSAEPKTPMGPQQLKARPRVANVFCLSSLRSAPVVFAGRCGQVGNHHSLSLEEEAGVSLVPPPLERSEHPIIWHSSQARIEGVTLPKAKALAIPSIIARRIGLAMGDASDRIYRKIADLLHNFILR